MSLYCEKNSYFPLFPNFSICKFKPFSFLFPIFSKKCLQNLSTLSTGWLWLDCSAAVQAIANHQRHDYYKEERKFEITAKETRQVSAWLIFIAFRLKTQNIGTNVRWVEFEENLKFFAKCKKLEWKESWFYEMNAVLQKVDNFWNVMQILMTMICHSHSHRPSSNYLTYLFFHVTDVHFHSVQWKGNEMSSSCQRTDLPIYYIAHLWFHYIIAHKNQIIFFIYYFLSFDFTKFFQISFFCILIFFFKIFNIFFPNFNFQNFQINKNFAFQISTKNVGLLIIYLKPGMFNFIAFNLLPAALQTNVHQATRVEKHGHHRGPNPSVPPDHGGVQQLWQIHWADWAPECTPFVGHLQSEWFFN